jgi:Zn-dependent membrane protease YugP
MILVVAGLLVLALVVGPSLWVHATMKRHAGDRPDLAGTGGELARHLLDEAGLADVKVEHTDHGDHYDPDARAVRLTDANLAGRSITAVAVAAHEVGHALQHAEGSRLFAARTWLATALVWTDRLAVLVLVAAPLLFVFVKSPGLMVAQIALGLAVLALGVVTHLVTLPLELNASFRRALPTLEHGRYIEGSDVMAARSVLRAAAFTYVAAALLTLVNVLRWVRVLT